MTNDRAQDRYEGYDIESCIWKGKAIDITQGHVCRRCDDAREVETIGQNVDAVDYGERIGEHLS
jgi:hypothetical protein